MEWISIDEDYSGRKDLAQKELGGRQVTLDLDFASIGLRTYRASTLDRNCAIKLQI